MSDETVNYGSTNPVGDAAASGTTAERVGFCQDCGTPLTKETMKNVGGGVFCEPCLQARVGAPAPGSAAYAVPPIGGQPHPWLAVLISLFPGAGACYNGQYAKGVVHLIVFAVLISFADHVSSIFGLFVTGWILYQMFDAYHTAKARLDGTPLPNPFGLNDIGERMGFGKGWTNVGGTWTAAPNAGVAGTPVPPATTYGAPVSTGPDWVGYVPPTNFTSAPVPPPAAAQAASAWGQAPYTQTYAPGPAAVPPTYTVNVPPVDVLVGRKRFPVGAIWLVGLGVLFLLAEFAPEWGLDWNISGRWLLPLLFAGLAIWSATRRMAMGMRTIRAFRASVILMTLAVLFALQAADVARLHRTWPVFLIVLGGLLLAERTALNTAAFASETTLGGSFVPTETAAEAAERTRATWQATEPSATSTGVATTHPDGTSDSTKGGY